MSRCIFCKHCPDEFEHCDLDDEYGTIIYYGNCKFDEYRCVTLCDDGIFGFKCKNYEPRPQQEIDTIKAALKLIGIDVEGE